MYSHIKRLNGVRSGDLEGHLINIASTSNNFPVKFTVKEFSNLVPHPGGRTRFPYIPFAQNVIQEASNLLTSVGMTYQ